MDIGAKDWELGKSYKVDDIVRIENLSLPYYVDVNNPSNTDGFFQDVQTELVTYDGDNIATDLEEFLIINPKIKGQVFTKATIKESGEINFGYYFPVNKKIDYKSRVRIKKNNEISETIDPYNTFVKTEEDGSINQGQSIGIGIGIKFLDENQIVIQPKDFRKTMRLMACSELSHTEYYNTQVYVKSEDIPDGAVAGVTFIFIYGLDRGSFTFRDIKTTSASEYFYCTQDHVSDTKTLPNSNGDAYWTQDFKWRPSYGSKSDFTAINDSMKLGEGSDYVNNLSINSLPMSIDILFDNRTDKQAKAIMHFLQEKHFAYESMFGINDEGNRLGSSEVGYFSFKYTNPYREDLKFVCSEFNHNIKYRNNNSISARFICNTESILRSVESNAGFNPRLDVILKIFIDEETHFKKGEKITLSTFPKPKDTLDENGEPVESAFEDLGVAHYSQGPIHEGENTGMITFEKPQTLNTFNCVYVSHKQIESTYVKVIHKVSDTVFLTQELGFDGPALITDSQSLVVSDSDKTIKTEPVNIPIVVGKMARCPEDCLSTAPFFPEGLEEISSETTDPNTGEKRKRIVFLKDFRQFQLEENITKGSDSITVTPLSSFTLNKEDDFDILIPAVRGRSSIYLRDPNRIEKFPWAQVRNLEHRPSLAFTLNATPSNIQTDFIKYYNKKYKKEINQNMSTFTVVFDQRDDEEVLEILQFLESHLGYKKFRFPMPRPHHSDSNHITTQSRKGSSTFYCPSWSHEIVYKNNHKITATFIESATSIQENLSDLQAPCYSAAVFDNINKHELCTFSSSAIATHQSGLETRNDNFIIKPKNKQIDLIFVVDGSVSVSQQLLKIDGVGEFSKYQIIMDSLIKSVTGHDKDKFPKSESYGGRYDTSGDPPWYLENYDEIYDETESIKFENDLKLEGYDIENFKRFNVRIEQNRVNIGICIVGHKAMSSLPLDQERILDLPDYPKSFDKKLIQEKLESTPHNYERGKEYLTNICDALSQLYNSNRASIISERYIFLISDFNFKENESSEIDKIREALRSGNELSKRRPLDSVLENFGSGSPREMLKEFSYASSEQSFPGDDEKFFSYLYNPDFSPDGDFGSVDAYEDYDESLSNPDWYDENLKTTILPVSLGVYNQINSKFYEYAEDYDSSISPEDIQMCYEISNGGSGSKEASRAVNFFKVIQSLTYDTGAQNLFSINIKNCGPNPIKIKNTIVNFLSDSGFAEWTTENIEPGITKTNDFTNFEKASISSNNENNIPGYGGQHFADPKNEKFLAEKKSNILWQNFNTRYEVWRNGKQELVDGGWDPEKREFNIETDDGFKINLDSGASFISDPIRVGPIKTQGVDNTGIAFKNFPARIFTSQKGLDIVDYNIGNVNEDNNYHGDYNHIPVLQEGESIDLFFGARFNSQSTEIEKIELLFNAEDLEDQKMACYAKFPMSTSD